MRSKAESLVADLQHGKYDGDNEPPGSPSNGTFKMMGSRLMPWSSKAEPSSANEDSDDGGIIRKRSSKNNMGRRGRGKKKVAAVPVYKDGLAGATELEEFHHEPLPFYIIVPASSLKQNWDMLMILLVMYTVIALPLQLAFTDSSTPPEGNHSMLNWDSLGFVETMIDLLFIIDFFLNCFVTYVDDSRWVTDVRLTLLHYLQRGAMIDFISSFPFDTFIASESVENLAIIKVLKVPRLLRIMRIYRQSMQYKHHNSWKVFRLYGGLFVVVHWLLCIFAILALYSANENGKDWFLSEFDRPWNMISVFEKYFACMYAMLLALFGGNPQPVAGTLTLFVCIVRFVGPVLQALIFGNIALVIGSANSSALDFRQRMQGIMRSFATMDLPDECVERITRYFEFEWSYARENDHHWIWDLNDDLKVSVLLHVNAKMFLKAKIFRDADTAFVVKLVTCLETLLLLPEDFAIHEGEEGDAMFFLLEGVCDIVALKIPESDDEDEEEEEEGAQFAVVRSLHPGDTFGEVALLLSNVTRTASVVAKTHVVLKKINRDEFVRCLVDFPAQRAKFDAYAEAKIKSIEKENTQVAKMSSKKIKKKVSKLPKGSAKRLSPLNPNAAVGKNEEADEPKSSTDDQSDKGGSGMSSNKAADDSDVDSDTELETIGAGGTPLESLVLGKKDPFKRVVDTKEAVRKSIVAVRKLSITGSEQDGGVVSSAVSSVRRLSQSRMTGTAKVGDQKQKKSFKVQKMGFKGAVFKVKTAIHLKKSMQVANYKRGGTALGQKKINPAILAIGVENKRMSRTSSALNMNKNLAGLRGVSLAKTASGIGPSFGPSKVSESRDHETATGSTSTPPTLVKKSHSSKAFGGVGGSKGNTSVYGSAFLFSNQKTNDMREDIDDIHDSVDNLENRFEAFEKKIDIMMKAISSLQQDSDSSGSSETTRRLNMFEHKLDRFLVSLRSNRKTSNAHG